MGYLIAFLIIILVIIMSIRAIFCFIFDGIKEIIKLLRYNKKQKMKSKPAKELTEYDKINFLIEDLKTIENIVSDKKVKKEINIAILNLTKINDISKEIDTEVTNQIIIDINDNVYEDIIEFTKKYKILIEYSDSKDPGTIKNFNQINQNLTEILPIFEQKLNEIKKHITNDITVKSDMLKTYIQ